MKRNIEDYIKPGAHAHLVGIGGVSVSYTHLTLPTICSV